MSLQKPKEDDQNDEDENEEYYRQFGCSMVVLGCLIFFAWLFAGLIVHILPPTNNSGIEALRNDWYYTLLVPAFLPTTFYFFYWNWLSLKFFRFA